jgi:hypothetical protein
VVWGADFGFTWNFIEFSRCLWVISFEMKINLIYFPTVMMDEPRFAQPIPNVTVAGT